VAYKGVWTLVGGPSGPKKCQMFLYSLYPFQISEVVEALKNFLQLDRVDVKGDIVT
jgi:hypothetical protein